jgi:hypothetical protein
VLGVLELVADRREQIDQVLVVESVVDPPAVSTRSDEA